ncbi:hypothetical protein NE235_09985 [Actinoallomurus spadix]|uniref:hypothetical protein n=1 Tax=Actinoallomurus spadix TaxID=79912 RepID=UPI002092F270|nr:hypothetical protein [Actinoallomurus spadix]MCO5986436.1 hypothetical protein [Actinoallomurus spadix]
MTPRSSTELALRPEGTGDEEVTHGYPPPARPAGTTVVAYCGAVMTVRGESTSAPPPDTCAECAKIWRRRRRRRSR